jgi:hypothetical protein
MLLSYEDKNSSSKSKNRILEKPGFMGSPTTVLGGNRGFFQAMRVETRLSNIF